jgi:hypothetical protein
MSHTTMISVLLGIVMTLCAGYEVYSAASNVAEKMVDARTIVTTSVFGE